MIITYFRSSSYNNFNLCQHQYYLTYCLGLPQPSGKRAEIGTVVHKVLEGLALGKVAHQDGKPSFDDHILGEISTDPEHWFDDIYIRELVDLSFNYYTEKSIHKWYPRDLRECYTLVEKALTQGEGMFDPRKREIVAAEPFFDFELPYEWAKYEWKLPNGDVIRGRLALRGTVDLILKHDDNFYEINDWKTGRRVDWATGKEKDYWKLDNDPQLRIYHYALSRKFPHIEHWAATMNFIAYGGPFTMHYGERDIELTVEMLRKQFERIKNCKRPSMRRDFFCSRVCWYGKNMSEKDPDQTICQYIHNKLLKVGIEQTTAEEIHPGFKIGTYEAPGE